MELMSEIPVEIAYPIWAGVVVGLLNAFKAYLPFLSEVSGVKNCEKRCKELQEEVDILRKDYRKLKDDYNAVYTNYKMLAASVKMIKSKLKSLGYENIPGLDDAHEK